MLLRAAAFEMLGNTAAAAQCMSALVAAEPHAGPLPDLGREAARTWVTYSSLSHPDTRRLRAMKLNWSLTVPGVHDVFQARFSACRWQPVGLLLWRVPLSVALALSVLEAAAGHATKAAALRQLSAF